MTFILLAGDAQATITWRTLPTRGLKRWLTFRNYAHSEPRFRALMADDKSDARFDVWGQQTTAARVRLSGTVSR